MMQPLSNDELAMLRGVFVRHPEITAVRIFGSRAKGTHSPHSDVDLAIWGEVDELRTQSIAAELDELPLPYRYDVVAFDTIKLPDLRDHINHIGIPIYPREGLG